MQFVYSTDDLWRSGTVASLANEAANALDSVTFSAQRFCLGNLRSAFPTKLSL